MFRQDFDGIFTFKYESTHFKFKTSGTLKTDTRGARHVCLKKTEVEKNWFIPFSQLFFPKEGPQNIFRIPRNSHLWKCLQARKRGNWLNTQFTQVLPIAGQIIPRYVEENLKIFSAFKFFIYISSMISHWTPNDVLWTPGWEPLA
jgi:hypothetical protein